MTNPLRKANENSRTRRLPSVATAAVASYASVVNNTVGRAPATSATSVFPNEEIKTINYEAPLSDNKMPMATPLERQPTTNKAPVVQTTLLILVCDWRSLEIGTFSN